MSKDSLNIQSPALGEGDFDLKSFFLKKKKLNYVDIGSSSTEVRTRGSCIYLQAILNFLKQRQKWWHKSFQKHCLDVETFV